MLKETSRERSEEEKTGESQKDEQRVQVEEGIPIRIEGTSESVRLT